MAILLSAGCEFNTAENNNATHEQNISSAFLGIDAGENAPPRFTVVVSDALGDAVNGGFVTSDIWNDVKDGKDNEMIRQALKSELDDYYASVNAAMENNDRNLVIYYYEYDMNDDKKTDMLVWVSGLHYWVDNIGKRSPMFLLLANDDGTYRKFGNNFNKAIGFFNLDRSDFTRTNEKYHEFYITDRKVNGYHAIYVKDLKLSSYPENGNSLYYFNPKTNGFDWCPVIDSEAPPPAPDNTKIYIEPTDIITPDDTDALQKKLDTGFAASKIWNDVKIGYSRDNTIDERILSLLSSDFAACYDMFYRNDEAGAKETADTTSTAIYYEFDMNCDGKDDLLVWMFGNMYWSGVKNYMPLYVFLAQEDGTYKNILGLYNGEMNISVGQFVIASQEIEDNNREFLEFYITDEMINGCRAIYVEDINDNAMKHDGNLLLFYDPVRGNDFYWCDGLMMPETVE